MKRLIIISTFLLFSSLSFGQENKYSIGILGSFDEFDYNLSDKILLSLEPYLRIGFNAIDNDRIESNSILYGEIISINYKLK